MPRDEAWFDGFYRQHERLVLAYCTRRVGAVDAGDATAKTFAVAWTRRDDVPEGERATRWLYGVARRILSHHWRGAGRAARLAERAGVMRTIPPRGPELTVIDSLEHQLVRNAVMSLSSTDREVLMLSAWEGLTHVEIADVLDVSVAAVDKRVARAKVRLAERYESLMADSVTASRATPVGDESPSPVRAPKGGGAP